MLDSWFSRAGGRGPTQQGFILGRVHVGQEAEGTKVRNGHELFTVVPMRNSGKAVANRPRITGLDDCSRC